MAILILTLTILGLLVDKRMFHSSVHIQTLNEMIVVKRERNGQNKPACGFCLDCCLVKLYRLTVIN